MLAACGRVGFEAGEPAPDAAAAIATQCTCGDVDQDGNVDYDDIRALGDILSRPRALDDCLAWAADTTGDGFLDGDDISALNDMISGAAAGCAP